MEIHKCKNLLKLRGVKGPSPGQSPTISGNRKERRKIEKG